MIPQHRPLPVAAALFVLLLMGCRASGNHPLPVPAAPRLDPVHDPVASQQGEPPTLVSLLLEQGVLTAEQAAALAAVPPERGPSVRVGPGGFRVASRDGSTSIRIGGRLQADANWHLRDTALDEALIEDGTEVRRARFELKGTLPHDFLWVAELDFANNEAAVKDFWMGWQRPGAPLWALGHQKVPYSLAVEMSSNDLPFAERGVDNFLIIPFVDRAIGVRGQHNSEHLFAAASVFGNSVSPTNDDDDGWGVAARFVTAPILEDRRVLHLGLRSAFRQPSDGSESVRIRDESTNMSNFRVLDTGVIDAVDGTLLYGAEFTLAHGPFSIGGEYNVASIDRAGEDFDFTSWHVAGTYSLTGESHASAYRIGAGEFKRLVAAPESRCGAWELAARLANLDLNDGGLSAGEEDALTLGLVWYATRNVRFLLNWTRLIDTNGGSAETRDAEGLDIFTFRGQLNF
ncbi:MAG: porin [Planctomycetota bacterium]